MTELLYEIIGKRVRRARQDADLSQEDLGKKAGLPLWKISDIELGKMRVMVIDLKAIAVALGKDESWFLSDQEGPIPPPRTLRSRARDLPPQALQELVDFVGYIMEKYESEEAGGKT
jgi:transcriptional regulator with XRE-family HTH domain